MGAGRAAVWNASWKKSLWYCRSFRHPWPKYGGLPFPGFLIFLFYGFSNSGMLILLKVILEKTIRIPRSLSVKAASVLKGFLNKNPADRLGCHRETGFYDIANHPFFKSIEWEPVCIFKKWHEKEKRCGWFKLKLTSEILWNGIRPYASR